MPPGRIATRRRQPRRRRQAAGRSRHLLSRRAPKQLRQPASNKAAAFADRPGDKIASAVPRPGPEAVIAHLEPPGLRDCSTNRAHPDVEEEAPVRQLNKTKGNESPQQPLRPRGGLGAPSYRLQNTRRGSGWRGIHGCGRRNLEMMSRSCIRQRGDGHELRGSRW